MRIFRIRYLPIQSLRISLLMCLSTITSLVEADDDVKKNHQNALESCFEAIERVCGQKPILLPGKTSAYPSCVSKSIKTLDENCETLLASELEKNSSAMLSKPKILK